MQAHTNKTGRCVRGGKSGWRTQPNHQNYSSLSQRRASERGREREGERKKEREREQEEEGGGEGAGTCVCSPSEEAHVFGVEELSYPSAPARQHGPRSVGGIGIIDHIDPGGVVPSVTKVVWLSVRSWVVPACALYVTCNM